MQSLYTVDHSNNHKANNIANTFSLPIYNNMVWITIRTLAFIMYVSKLVANKC